MPYKIETQLPLVTVTFYDEATFEEIGEAGKEIRSLPEFMALKHVLLDGLNISFSQGSEVLKIIKQASIDKTVAKDFHNRKLAFVATDPIIVDWSAIYRWEMEKYNWQIECFSNLEDASEWFTDGKTNKSAMII